MLEQYYKILRRPIVTERTTEIGEKENKVVFEVALKADKLLIAQAVEAVYQVKVVGVNTSIVRGKIKRFGKNVGKRSNWKKAVVTLKEGDNIDFFANA